MLTKEERDLNELRENHHKFIEAINAQLALANKYVEGGGHDEMWSIRKLIDDFNVWLEKKIKEKYQNER